MERLVPSSDRATGHWVDGTVSLRRVGRLTFPTHELVVDGDPVAHLGRPGWIRVFFGRGQRIELVDGSRWRLKSIGSGGMICPAVFDSERRRIAVSSLAVGGYGINGRDYGCMLYEAEKRRISRANRWILREHDDDIGEVARHPAAITAEQPVHLGAAVLTFVLVRYGILGERAPRFNFQWKA